MIRCVQGTSVCQVTLIGIMVVLLYASRACYNLVVLALTDIETINSFDYDWYNVSDQVRFINNELNRSTFVKKARNSHEVQIQQLTRVLFVHWPEYRRAWQQPISSFEWLISILARLLCLLVHSRENRGCVWRFKCLSGCIVHYVHK